jgi:hypothetical protein
MAFQEIEGSNRAQAYFVDGGNVLSFHWDGAFTKGRAIHVKIVFFATGPECYLDWCTGTGKESTYLSLPSRTDEVATGGRGGAGWVMREPSKLFSAEAA